MGVPPGAYCDTADLRIGDIALGSQSSPTQYVQGAAEEIDIALGRLYVTPIVIPDVSENRPSKLFLKKINWLLASARALFDVYANEDDADLKYPASMLREAQVMLKSVTDGDVELVGAPKVEGAETSNKGSGPIIINEDPVSLVADFYKGFQPLGLRQQVTPYGRG